VAVELTADNQRALWIPPGFAHGFLTLCDETDVFYQMTAAYQPAFSAGLRWDDPALGIPWPATDPIVSPRDRALPGLRDLPSATPAQDGLGTSARSTAPTASQLEVLQEAATAQGTVMSHDTTTPQEPA
jgi:hypothetical protein